MALRSEPDARDWHFESICGLSTPTDGDTKTTRSLLPGSLDLRHTLKDARNQGQSSTCAAQVAACIKEGHEFQDSRAGQSKRYFSPQFVYNQRPRKDREGMTGREVMAILTQKGCCLESDYPLHSVEVIHRSIRLKAKKYRISGYARVTTVEGLKRALVDNGPCFISFPCFNHLRPDFWTQHPGSRQVGGHGVAVVGYNSTGFFLRNSWGTEWGNDGCVEYSFADFRKGLHWEVWTCVDDLTGAEEQEAPPSFPPTKVEDAQTPQDMIKSLVHILKPCCGK